MCPAAVKVPGTSLVWSKMSLESLSRRDQQRNFRLGVLNGAVFNITTVLIDTEIVLAWFLTQLGVSNFWIGLLPPIRMGSAFMLQILVSGYLQQRPYKQPFYRWMATIRFGVLLIIALAVSLIPAGSPWLVIVFMALLTVYSMGAELTSLAFMDVVGKAVSPTRRGSFFAQRAFWGSILSIGAGSLVGFLLTGPGGLAFPRNVALLFGLASLSLALAAGFWSMVKEPPSEVQPERVRWLKLVQRGARFLQDNRPYRTYILVRLCAMLAGMAGPFYVVYAKTVLNIPAQMIGVYLTARTMASILSNLLWGRISDRKGNRWLIQIATVVSLAMPLLVLTSGVLLARVPGAMTWLPWAFTLVFVASGASSAASGIASSGYLLDVAPPAQRPLYLGFTNTIFGISIFMSSLGGLIVEWSGFATLMILSAAFYGLVLLLSAGMVEPRIQKPEAQLAAPIET